MNARRIALLAGAIVGALALVLLVLRPSPVTGQSDGIIVVDADAVFTSTVSGPSHTPDLQPRFVVWYANSIKYYNDVGPPGNLPISLTDRVVFWYANANRAYSLAYPLGLTGDITPTQISGVTAIPDPPDSATIVWYTDEFADSAVRYGTEPGVYTEAVTDTLYYKRHEIPLIGLTSCITYYYQVRSTDRDGNTATSAEHTFNLVCAGFTASPTSGPDPLPVVFTNTSTGVYTDSLWRFGDGDTSTQENPTHIYWTPGVYTVTLAVSGVGGTDTLTRTNYITVYEHVEADFTAAPTSGAEPLTVAFTNTSTGDRATNLWDFGDGITSTQENPTHIYDLHGAYDVSLTVSGLGGTDTENRPDYITVYEPVTADFDASPTSGPASLLVAFTNNSSGDYTTSSWNFGDGGTSTTNHPTHSYTVPGVYTVILTVSGPGGTDTYTRIDYITVYEPVQADFTAAPRSGIESATVAFLNTSDGDYDTSLWDFGDGVTSTQESPTHPYTQPGAYDVSLTVSGLGGTDTESRSAYINVYQQPVAGFTAFPTVGFAELEVVFVNTSTGDYTTSLWDFGDGGPTSTEEHPIRTYTLPGVYTVTLTVSGLGGTGTYADRITVYEPVNADFVASPTFGIAPLIVHFADTSGGPVDTWEWAFGDGQMSVLQHPVHTYLTTGTYTVSLSVRAPTGSAVWPGGTDTLTRTGYVTVGVPLYMPIVIRNG